MAAQNPIVHQIAFLTCNDKETAQIRFQYARDLGLANSFTPEVRFTVTYHSSLKHCTKCLTMLFLAHVADATESASMMPLNDALIPIPNTVDLVPVSSSIYEIVAPNIRNLLSHFPSVFIPYSLMQH